MITRIVRMRFRPEAVDTFMSIWQESRQHIRARQGCLEANLYKDHGQDHVFYTLSRWASPADLEAYRKSELFGQVWPRTKALFASPPEAHSLESVAD
jgi:quinol monooxygenase YgiN